MFGLRQELLEEVINALMERRDEADKRKQKRRRLLSPPFYLTASQEIE